MPGSVQAIQELATAIPDRLYRSAPWLYAARSPSNGCVRKDFQQERPLLAESQAERLTLVKELRTRYDFIAGIGDRWDDNELHAELGCLSVILQEHEGNFPKAVERIERYRRESKIHENEIHLHGKVEGLARVCPLLQAEFGERLWEGVLQGSSEEGR